jgi:hypothetical protein
LPKILASTDVISTTLRFKCLAIEEWLREISEELNFLTKRKKSKEKWRNA